MFRELNLPDHVHGAVFLHSMPGRREAIEDALCAMKSCSITQIVSLAPCHEIREKAPTYAQALASGLLPIPHQSIPIEDCATPPQLHGLVEAVENLADRVSTGERMLVHCGAGIGRTGLFAASLLLALGLSHDDALALVKAAGSCPENQEQRLFLKEVAKILSARGS